MIMSGWYWNMEGQGFFFLVDYPGFMHELKIPLPKWLVDYFA